jgi:hypothetical protein
METISTKRAADAAGKELFVGDEWFDPLEAGVRHRIRGFIEAMLESELEAALSRGRDERRGPAEAGGDSVGFGVAGHRHSHRERSLVGSFGPVRLRVPRAGMVPPARRHQSESRRQPSENISMTASATASAMSSRAWAYPFANSGCS